MKPLNNNSIGGVGSNNNNNTASKRPPPPPPGRRPQQQQQQPTGPSSSTFSTSASQQQQRQPSNKLSSTAAAGTLKSLRPVTSNPLSATTSMAKPSSASSAPFFNPNNNNYNSNTANNNASYYGGGIQKDNSSTNKNVYNSWSAPSSKTTAVVHNDDTDASASADSDWFTPDNTTAAALLPNSISQANNNSVFGSSTQQGVANNSNSNLYMQPLQGRPSKGVPETTNNTLQPSFFIPSASSTYENTSNNNNNNFDSTSYVSGTPSKQNYDDYDDLPLLEELGINLEHIYLKTKAVVLPFKRFHQSTEDHHSALHDPQLIVQDADLAGPLVFALALGAELLLFAGKIQFGYIYGFGLFGCLSMTLVINLLSPAQAVSIWTVTSVLGYSLLPVNILAAVKILLPYSFGRAFGCLTIIWSTTASTRLLEVGCAMRDQRYLLAYPIALLYSAFVLITIF